MQLGKLCKYAGDCPVYKKENKRIKKPFFWCGTCFATGVTQVGRTANAMNCWKKEKQFQ